MVHHTTDLLCRGSLYRGSTQVRFFGPDEMM